MQKSDLEISGVQYYWQVYHQEKLDFLEGKARCHICGGPLTVHHIPQKGSDNWTSEQTCKSKESMDICKACDWATMKKGEDTGMYTLFKDLPDVEMVNKAMLAVTPEGLYHPKVQDFLDMLTDEKSYPGIFAVNYDGGQVKKHSTLYVPECISYDKHGCNIWFGGLADKKDTTLSGVVTVDADKFAEEVRELSKAVADNIDKYFIPKGQSKEFSRRTNALCTLARLRVEDWLSCTDAEYLRDFVACSLMAGL